MCSDEADVLREGRQLVEFELTRAAGNATIGVAQANYDPLRVYLPGEPRGEAGESWGMSTRSGSLSFRGKVNSWAGRRPAAEGDRVGMLVDLGTGSLTVFLNRVKLGTMVASGLEGPLLWMTELSTAGDSVRIERIDPLQRGLRDGSAPWLRPCAVQSVSCMNALPMIEARHPCLSCTRRPARSSVLRSAYGAVAHAVAKAYLPRRRKRTSCLLLRHSAAHSDRLLALLRQPTFLAAAPAPILTSAALHTPQTSGFLRKH